MTVPTWDEFMVPVLRELSGDETIRRRDLFDRVARSTGLSETDMAEILNSGQPRYENRIGWAISYLKKVEGIDYPKRGYYAITERGRELLDKYPAGITEKELRKFVDYPDTPSTRAALELTSEAANEHSIQQSKLDPIEQIEDGVKRLYMSIAGDLLMRLHENDPAFFEQAVLDLLIAMGYGGTQGKATRTQLSNDGGIDGVIDQDALGLNRIYVQAKRYALDATIGRPEIQGFVGALQGVQAHQGVFLTTANFSKGARSYAESVASRVVLIDGERLAALMIRYGVGVQVKRTVEIVEVDEDFFE